MKKPVIDGLYAITPDERDTAKLMAEARLVLRGGAKALQYRNKTAALTLRLDQALGLRQLTREFDAMFIVNDDVGLARQSGADGVHLGAQDGGVAVARQTLGEAGIVGVSCYNRAPLALEAVTQGADYVAFGSFFTSPTKPDAMVATQELLRQARHQLDVPIVAIGGITIGNGAQLLDAGADALAVISALWNAPDIEQAARGFSNLFDKASA